MNTYERLYTYYSSYWLPFLMTSFTVNISLYSLAAHFTDYWVTRFKMNKKPQTNQQPKKPHKETWRMDTDVQPLSGALLLLMAKSFCFRRTMNAAMTAEEGNTLHMDKVPVTGHYPDPFLNVTVTATWTKSCSPIKSHHT